MNGHRTVALIVAAGRGERSGSALPKQFASVAGRPMVAHSHAALAGHAAVDAVVVVTGTDQFHAVQVAVGPVQCVAGGATRRQSVLAGLESIAAAGGADRVLIHDAARPFLPTQVIDRLLGALDSASGAVPVLAVADTVARCGGALGDVVPRDGLVRVQTPQAFIFSEILAAHRGWSGDAEPTDDAQMLRAAGGMVAPVTGDTMLEKVTYPDDFAAAEARAAARYRVRSATGYDVHRLEAGEELWLGGVLIPHDRGLSGHSDADVGLHALTDALLGTIGAGDIGTHFPPTDPQWKGAASDRFLVHAADLIRARGGIIDFVDLTLICEAPKIGPHREAIRGRMAELLNLQEDQVSIKATTTERLGFTGRSEGIAAQAIATVRIPEAG
ncbi:bifunctional 2-C-methyl-D-erythritol 4-phosphate cytidylyltransferase/2-C-methyl-D-erythritol 2,4-cyclodiphosphate synthase [Sphingomonas desiccabilis]|uniref:Bifunctional enzyme IspD/IspF n=1 Tax=Sphingomonas desiccabilis TaxID=429134 RepID=A0A4Q2J168_9SPHN|nr:bifunctional 2-C-methyl-D-erythritol 4-phosphate cytidylyltransferase/2-C-methyl-D-erythritol 2,4-cyclodiphosphate synthase [Sphingomonas desiccabilis]MBB3910666.1 2-C-methyl-D-erythritol 4-phosphate cytidylyltransferase/2-C-methyl-D-erythritol 2,4-cyclodiphosphate synthase [Sphingomonas desiccabilis]RXZ35291.1 bifunctional 2-C-methyl-D-erythritol 4-phosphate cytidylyltransferase/2-C-methyl-D-erythritol 2,4-cyclodiphosphate synthase [Sphingomonas desiccabilis]